MSRKSQPEFISYRNEIRQLIDDKKPYVFIIQKLEEDFGFKCTKAQIAYFVQSNPQWFPDRQRVGWTKTKAPKEDKIEVIANILRQKIIPIGGTNLISEKLIERKLTLDTFIKFTHDQMCKAINKLIIEGRLISKGNGFFIICAPKVEGFKSVGEVAAAIHKAIGAKHAA